MRRTRACRDWRARRRSARPRSAREDWRRPPPRTARSPPARPEPRTGRPALPQAAPRSGGQRGPRELAALLQAGNDQVQQAEAELRILEIQLLELIIVDLCRLHVGLAAHRHGTPAIGGEQTDL